MSKKEDNKDSSIPQHDKGNNENAESASSNESTVARSNQVKKHSLIVSSGSQSVASDEISNIKNVQCTSGVTNNDSTGGLNSSFDVPSCSGTQSRTEQESVVENNTNKHLHQEVTENLTGDIQNNLDSTLSDVEKQEILNNRLIRKVDRKGISSNENASFMSSLDSYPMNQSYLEDEVKKECLSTSSVVHRPVRNGSSMSNANRNNCAMHRSAMSTIDSNRSCLISHTMSNLSPTHNESLEFSHCCHNHHHYHQFHSLRRDSSMGVGGNHNKSSTEPFNAARKSLDLGMSSVQATTIISNHCNTENNTSAPNSGAVTTLTSSSSSRLPVAALTKLELSKTDNRFLEPYNWQAYLPTLKDRMAVIFNCEFLADVCFIVGKDSLQTRFPAHKFVLSIGSAVFNAMFNGLLTQAVDKEKLHMSDSTIKEIEIPDVEPDAFKALLRFLYLDEVIIGPETVMATLYAAKKYEILALEVACVDFLKENLSAENAFMLLTQARLFDETNLADLCLESIDKHTMDALYSDSFLEIDLDTLKLVLNRDTLRVREVSLFIAVIRWAECECARRDLKVNGENKRRMLGDALYLIRFPLMEIQEFASYVAQSELLTDKEVVNMFLHYTVSAKPSVPFSLAPRCMITGEEHTVKRFQRTESRWGYSGSSDRIRFLTDRPIFVIGFGLYGSIQCSSEYEVIIEIILTGTGKVLASNSTSFISDGSDSVFRVMFKYPVEIAQNTSYTASVTLKGLDSFYGTNGIRTHTITLGKGKNKDSVTFQFSYSAGCNNGTSVEDGQIPEIYFYCKKI